MSEVETPEIKLTPKEYKALMTQLSKLERRELLDVSRDVSLDVETKRVIYGIRLGMDFAAMNKKAWALGVIGLLWGFGMMFFWIGLAVAAL